MLYLILAFSLLTLYFLIYSVLSVFGIKIFSKKIFKSSIDNSILLLIVTLLVAIALVIMYVYYDSTIILFPLAINLGVALQTYIRLKSTD